MAPPVTTVVGHRPGMTGVLPRPSARIEPRGLSSIIVGWTRCFRVLRHSIDCRGYMGLWPEAPRTAGASVGRRAFYGMLCARTASPNVRSGDDQEEIDD